MAEFASSKRRDMLVHSAEPLNAEPPRAALTSALTDERDCYVRNHGAVPEVDPRRWRLRVHGRLAESLELSLHELRERFDEHEITATLQCAGNRRDGFNRVRELPGEAPWGPSPGPVTITARAWDTSAAVQPESAAQLWNPKGYVNNSWARVRITAR